MHVFIAGIMQGIRLDDQIDDQNYRVRIGNALREKMPDVQITDPFALNPYSVDYDADQARQTFFKMTDLAATADVLIAYLPKTSMGTAMEMWQAYHNNAYIIAVTPHIHHWAIRFTADEILQDLDELLLKIEDGHLARVLGDRALVDVGSEAD